MPNYVIQCIEQEADNSIVGAKVCEETSQDVTYFSGIRITRSALVNGGSPDVRNLAAPVYYWIDGNTVTFRGSGSANDQYYTLPLDSANLTAEELKTLMDDCNCCGAGGGPGDGNDFVNGGSLGGNNLTLNRTDGGSVVIDLSPLANTDDFVVSGVLAGNTLTLTRDGGGTVPIDLSALAGGATDGTPYINNETGGNAPGAPAAPSNPPGSPTANSVVIEAFDDAIRYWLWNGAAWSLVYEQTIAAPTSQSIYDAGLGFWVKGTPGVVVTSGSAGVYDIDIPTGAIIDSIQKQFTNAGTEYTVGGEVVLNMDWNTGAFNTSFANAILPDVELHDPAGTEREPGDVFVTVQTTSVAGGVVSTTLANINGLGVPINMKVTL